jgi:uncharacterized protein YcaQ
MPAPTLDDLRRYAIARTLFKPTTLPKAIQKLGFVQADPIRAPARAQDLTLRHRVVDYRAGDLERRYARLRIEEDFFVNYGFVPHATHQLMHPRTPRQVWPTARWTQARAVLEFVRERGVVHPREVDAHFAHGKARNWFGGSSNASTQLLDEMHYRGLVRIARREGGVRLYAARADHPAVEDPAAAFDALIDVVVHKYAPLTAASLGQLVSHLQGGAPQWRLDRNAALKRAKTRLASSRVDGVEWFWPADENPASKRHAPDEAVRLLAPFDPVVWDRRRFEHFWGWAYRFEAYTPAAKRVRGYYALPLLSDLGYQSGRAPRAKAFRVGLEHELGRMRVFLNLAG